MAISEIPLEGYALLDAIAVDESEKLAKLLGIDPYFILLGGGSFKNLPGDDTGFPIWNGLRGSWGVSHAAGRYQDQPATWRAQAAKLGLDDFREPWQQDLANWDLAQTDYQRRSGRQLLPDLRAGLWTTVAKHLRATWTSVNVDTLGTRYVEALRLRQSQDQGAVAESGQVPAVESGLDILVAEFHRVVRELQAGLGLAVDGDWGPRSRAALQEYERGIRAKPVASEEDPATEALNRAELERINQMMEGSE